MLKLAHSYLFLVLFIYYYYLLLFKNKLKIWRVKLNFKFFYKPCYKTLHIQFLYLIVIIKLIYLQNVNIYVSLNIMI